MSADDIRGRLKYLQREQEALIEKVKELERRRKRGEISEEEYQEKRYDIERRFVEIMDRLAQMRFILGQGR